MKRFIDFLRPTKTKISVAVIIFFFILFTTTYCSFSGMPISEFTIPEPAPQRFEPTPDPYSAYRIGSEIGHRFFPCGYFPPIVYQLLDKIQEKGLFFGWFVYLLVSYLFTLILHAIRKSKGKK